MNALGNDKAMRAVVRERDALMQQCDGLANAHETMKRELELTSQFIARMVREYKAQLVKYIERAQTNIDTYHLSVDYWRAELIEAMRRLTLSDVELIEYITPAELRFIAKPH